MAGSTGSRPDRDLVIRKRDQAITLRLAGATYQQIADSMIEVDGQPRRLYANRQNARAAVLAALEERHYEGVDRYRELQRARYERMIRAVWSRALTGDWDAFTQLRHTMADLSRLMGTNMPTRLEVTDEMDREIAQLAESFQALDGTWDITGIPEGSPPGDIMAAEEQEGG